MPKDWTAKSVSSMPVQGGAVLRQGMPSRALEARAQDGVCHQKEQIKAAQQPRATIRNYYTHRTYEVKCASICSDLPAYYNGQFEFTAPPLFLITFAISIETLILLV